MALTLIKRQGWYQNSGNNARYAFLAFLIAVVVIIFTMTCFVNLRRIRAGRRPFVSRYLAPPSYYQSERQYETAPPPLPTYTAEANPQQDVGYYDQNGKFVPAKMEDTEFPPPPGATPSGDHTYANATPIVVSPPTDSGIQPAYLAQETTSPATSTPGSNSAYYSPRQGSSSPQSNAANSPSGYAPPPGPPPTHSKGN
ncbi:hypothetical protein FOA43_000997 [Brettanomyces nanus]|uniref:Uncharacterized protein n=1 Tax=Eeniella nana TaxID=13502 RepID=A0A875S2X9_EENNA|nr:uncharacterized protein FOA43_000997 [Brettanomyces nanus]QPG73684.1 hypothetical protein FOA43_000997 [Brettanomyces nanus]